MSSSTRSDGVSRQNSVDPWAGRAAAAADGNERRVARRLVDGVHFSAFGQELVFRALTEGIRWKEDSASRASFHVVRPESMDSIGRSARPCAARPRRGGTRCTRTRGARASRRRCRRRRRQACADGHDVDAAVERKTGLAALAVVAGAGLGWGARWAWRRKVARRPDGSVIYEIILRYSHPHPQNSPPALRERLRIRVQQPYLARRPHAVPVHLMRVRGHVQHQHLPFVARNSAVERPASAHESGGPRAARRRRPQRRLRRSACLAWRPPRPRLRAVPRAHDAHGAPPRSRSTPKAA